MSFTPSHPVTSSQTSLNKNLAVQVLKHLRNDYRKPIADHNKKAFEKAFFTWNARSKPPVILDSACGTAESTRYFSQKYRDCLVIGLDHSQRRLSHQENNALAENCLLLRCDCTDFWRLAAYAGWRFKKHYLLYPNPYPKPQHFNRRWHGHPAFPSLVAISDQIELRSNWKIYAEEFVKSLKIAGCDAELSQYKKQETMTAFERKYQLSGHELWRVTCNNMN
jgi:tRNA (guanine-N7-)-methyltransferase